jgi:NAD(P)-dependent dehydrogenase (short-subunit alcohol dehydrogenase family)
MNVDGKVAVVTGGAGGIGSALARALAKAGASVVVADLDSAKTAAVAEAIGGESASGDVSRAEVLRDIFALAERRFGPVDLFFANAGVVGEPGIGDDDEAWQTILDVNVLAHVRAARLLVPGWLERGSGYFVATASAAGLLTQLGAAPYSVTKHAALAFSEWLSVTYGGRGIGVSCLCPMGVNTNMLHEGLEAEDKASQISAKVVAHAGEVLEPDEVAKCVLEAVEQERFLVTPHPEVLEYFGRKGRDYERWLSGMRRLLTEVSGS